MSRGRLHSLSLIVVGLVGLSTIQAVFGTPASNWFGLGFLTAAVMAFWEAGKDAAQGGVTEGGDAERGSGREATSTRSAEGGCAQPSGPPSVYGDQ